MEFKHRPRLYSAEQVRELDRRAIDELGIPGYTLMQRAARASFDALRARWPAAKTIVILAGPGNNGGDGYELASIARREGMRVHLAHMGSLPTSGDALKALANWKRAGGRISEYSLIFCDQVFAGADVLVDAIFGIGMSRPVTGLAADAIGKINARRRDQGALAIDIPSGLDAVSGLVRGVAVRADITVSFIGRKLGLFVGQGPEYCGVRHFCDLGAEQVCDGRGAALAELLMPEELQLALPVRAAIAHKGNHGHVLVVGGEQGMAGAALLAARAALRCGAGLVSVATRAAHAHALTVAQPEAMFHAVEAGQEMAVLLSKASVVVLGPGLGQSDWGAALFEQCLGSDHTMVVDADALNLMSRKPPPLFSARSVLTPHPGEAARLLDISTAEVQSDRIGAAKALRQKYGAVIVLKGSDTIVLGERLAICPFGNPGMAVGGMGDVLAGVIAALIGQGLELESAAAAGVLAHALAGDRAAGDCPRGLLPSDLLDALRVILNPQ